MHTWEEAVRWLREQPEHQRLVLDCYYDDPIEAAAERFWRSDEWQATRPLLPPRHGPAMDLGAGRGVASYALARDGWVVAALEPDGSSVVGAMVIAALASRARVPLNPVRQYGESLPFGDATFQLVYARAALHHARDLNQLSREVARVLRPGGRFVAVREHVVSDARQLHRFLASHPLHGLYGGENAHTLGAYLAAIQRAGLHVLRILGPLDTVVNAAPLTRDEWLAACRGPVARLTGQTIASRLLSEEHTFGRWSIALSGRLLARITQTPGRLFSFVAERPLE